MASDINAQFEAKFWGRFSGVLRWSQLDALWERVCARKDQWYVYRVAGEPPSTVMAAEELCEFVRDVDGRLRREHEHDYCGIVYADSVDDPAMIKIYHPRKLGAVCGSSAVRILPEWVLSRLPPSRVDETVNPLRRYHWWERILKRE